MESSDPRVLVLLLESILQNHVLPQQRTLGAIATFGRTQTSLRDEAEKAVREARRVAEATRVARTQVEACTTTLERQRSGAKAAHGRATVQLGNARDARQATQNRLDLWEDRLSSAISVRIAAQNDVTAAEARVRSAEASLSRAESELADAQSRLSSCESSYYIDSEGNHIRYDCSAHAAAVGRASGERNAAAAALGRANADLSAAQGRLNAAIAHENHCRACVAQAGRALDTARTACTLGERAVNEASHAIERVEATQPLVDRMHALAKVAQDAAERCMVRANHATARGDSAITQFATCQRVGDENAQYARMMDSKLTEQVQILLAFNAAT